MPEQECWHPNARVTGTYDENGGIVYDEAVMCPDCGEQAA